MCALTLYLSMGLHFGLNFTQRLEPTLTEELGSLVLALCIIHGRFSSPRPTQWSSGKINRVALVMEHPSGLQRATGSCERRLMYLGSTDGLRDPTTQNFTGSFRQRARPDTIM